VKDKKIVHITKGTIGGLDTITSKISNSIGGKNILLTERDPFDLYDNKTFIGSYKFGPEIIFPKIKNFSLFFKLLFQSKVIHIHITNLVIFFLFPFFLGKKVIFSIHKNFGGGYDTLYKKNIAKKISFKLLRFISLFSYINYMVLTSSKIILLADSQKKDFRKFSLFKKKYDQKAIVITNFIPKNNLLSKKKKISKVKISFIGRLGIYKGFHDLIRLINSLPKDIEFNIIGEGRLENEIPSRKNINQSKNINPKNLNKFYDSSNILILPSYSETCGLVILEAMSRGLVILASDLPSIREYFKDGRNGYLFEPGDVEKMKKLILYLKNNPQERDRISKNNLKDIYKFTSEKQIPKYMNIYKEILNEK
jgi:glycosyltransferase involved in cell wall biosynthesis